MAFVSSAILCDFCQVREGLLFVSSGALTRMYRADLPGPMLFMVAAIMEISYEELGWVHELTVAVKEVDSAEQIFRMTGGFQTGSVDLEPGESLYLPLVVDLRGAALKSYGAHDVQLNVDGVVGLTLTFYVRTPPPAQ